MATDAPWARSENALQPDAGMDSRPSPMNPGPPSSGINDADLAVLKSAFTPQVIEALSRLAQSGGTEPGATSPMPATGAMPETPVTQPGLPRPTTALGRMG
jgi:hypothetical protein